ncbi:unnamed protein product [Ectocarpus sp. 4 AP-2014]
MCLWLPPELGSRKRKVNTGRFHFLSTYHTPLRSLPSIFYARRFRNPVARTVPVAVGALTGLNELRLHNNKLTVMSWTTFGRGSKNRPRWFLFCLGSIPETLGALKELTLLWLGGNKLTGSIPAWLGSPQKLQELGLYRNHLAGPIPEALGTLKELTILWLHDNMLTGHLPKELGKLEQLRELRVQNNRLTSTSVIPTELGNLGLLSKFEFENNAPKSIWRRRKNISGEPGKGERLVSWRERIRPQQDTKPRTLKGYEKEEDAPVLPNSPPPVLPPQQQEGYDSEDDDLMPPGSPNRGQEAAGEPVRSPESARRSDRLFRAQLSSSTGLDSLFRANSEALDDMQRVIKAPAVGSFYFDDEVSDMERRRKLGTLMTMSTALGEVAVSPNGDIQRKELGLAPFSKGYYNAVRSGLCQAYLAASHRKSLGVHEQDRWHGQGRNGLKAAV